MGSLSEVTQLYEWAKIVFGITCWYTGVGYMTHDKTMFTIMRPFTVGFMLLIIGLRIHMNYLKLK